MTEELFENIRPFHDSEVNPAMHRISNNPLFKYVTNFLYPDEEFEKVKLFFQSLNSADDFQSKVMYSAINKIADKTMTKFVSEGMDFLNTETKYLFLSNHRDILLDSALLQVVLRDHNHKTSEISFGSNLMNPEFIVDVGKSNKMFRVERAGGNPREFYNKSKELSEYIRYTIQEKKESIWLAHRNGRTKDGNDQTFQGVLKMFTMSGPRDLSSSFAEINIAPYAISYQYEPCIVSKVRELYMVSKNGKYVKDSGEDLKSVVEGIKQFKGEVYMTMTNPIEKSELDEFSDLKKADFYLKLAELIDKRIHLNYKLYDTNYMAFDSLNGNQKYLNTEYSSADLVQFEKVMQTDLARIEGNVDELRTLYLNIYANPVINSLKYN